MAKRGNVATAERQIKELTNIKTFYDDVRKIVGYYDDSLWWEDWDIKAVQRIADARYHEIGGEL